MNKSVHYRTLFNNLSCFSIRYDITAIVISFHGSGPKELVPQVFCKRYLHLVTIDADPQSQTSKE